MGSSPESESSQWARMRLRRFENKAAPAWTCRVRRRPSVDQPTRIVKGIWPFKLADRGNMRHYAL